MVPPKGNHNGAFSVYPEMPDKIFALSVPKGIPIDAVGNVHNLRGRSQTLEFLAD
jgi:hypothetical protein